MIKEEVKIETQGSAKSVKELKAELKALKDQMVEAGRGTEEYSEALKKAADIQHELKEQMTEINNSAQDFGQKLGNVTNTMAGMTGAITAATGALSLMGIENDEVKKKIDDATKSLFMITEGLGKIDNGVKAFKRLTLAINTGSGALGKFKLALVSTGIGALVVILGSVIAYWDDFTKAIGLSTEKLNKLKDIANGVFNVLSSGMKGIASALGKLLKGDFEGALEEIKRAFDIAANYGEGVSKSAEDRLRAQREADAAEAKKLYEEQKKRDEERKKADEEKAKAAEEAARKAAEAYKKQQEAAAKLAKFEKDMAEAKSRDKNYKWTEEAYKAEMKYYSRLEEIYKYDAEKFREVQLEKEQYLQQWSMHFRELADAEIQKRKELIESYEDELKSEEEKLNERYAVLMDAYTKEGKDTTALKKWYADEIDKIKYGDARDLISEFEEELMTEQQILDRKYMMYIEAAEKLGMDTTAIRKKWEDESNALAEQAAEEAQNIQMQKIQAFGQMGNAMGSMLQSISNNMEEGSKQQKAMAISAATIQMLVGIGTALSGAFTTKSGPWDLVLAGIQATTIAANGIAQIKKIKEQKPNGSSSATTSVPQINLSSVVGSAPEFSQTVDGAMTQASISDTRVFVTERDITSTQNKVRVTENNARY